MDKRRSRVQRAYGLLKEGILSARLKPGALIAEEEYATRLNMSRTPIREALSKLEQEGLVRRIPQRGVFVTELSVNDFLEICEVRDLLESHACRIAAKRADPRDLERFEKEFLALDLADPDEDAVRRANEIDRKFHQFTLGLAGNQRVVEIISHLNDLITRLRFALTPSRYHESLEEHRRILKALKANDPEEAWAAMHDHIDAVRRSLHRIRA